MEKLVMFVDTPECLMQIMDLTGESISVDYTNSKDPVLKVREFQLKVGDYIGKTSDGGICLRQCR